MLGIFSGFGDEIRTLDRIDDIRQGAKAAKQADKLRLGNQIEELYNKGIQASLDGIRKHGYWIPKGIEDDIIRLARKESARLSGRLLPRKKGGIALRPSRLKQIREARAAPIRENLAQLNLSPLLKNKLTNTILNQDQVAPRKRLTAC